MAIFAIALASCGSSRTQIESSKELTTQNSVVQYPTVVDLIVSPQKVTAQMVWDKKKMNKAEVTSTVMSRAAKKADADIIVEPRYEYVFDHGVTTIIMTGFPAKLVNFRKATPDDASIITTIKNAGVTRETR